MAKLDRLARNVAFTSALIRDKVDFLACDNPYATKLTIHILAAVAKHELEIISSRIKAALAQAKQRGVKLGAQNPKSHGKLSHAQLLHASRLGCDANRRHAEQFRQAIMPVAQSLRDQGLSSVAIADKLNADGYTTRRGLQWNQWTVLRLLMVEPWPATLLAK